MDAARAGLGPAPLGAAGMRKANTGTLGTIAAAGEIVGGEGWKKPNH